MTKAQLVERVLRNLGHPMIKIELKYQHIVDAIDYARDKFLKHAVGNVSQETFFTMALEAGKCLYDMPVGVTDVLSYTSTGISSGINTLFTVDNYLYSRGMLDGLINNGSGYELVSYHIAMDFLETLRRYTPDRYNFKYHQYTNQLEIHPAPPSGGELTYTPTHIDENGDEVADTPITIDSPGFILLRTFMLEGSTFDPSFDREDLYENFYGSSWIIEYSTSYAKRTLGMIRRKFASFGSMGNQGIALDGSELISEANEEMERLNETLKNEYCYIGYGIEVG
jgi:hypothetical protein